MMKSLFAAASLFVGASAYSSDALADQITNLPGQPEGVTFNQFSGYLTVAETKQMHYWFVESMNEPSTDPIAFWTNGGPGCSGLIGFMTEQGPFRPNADMTLSFNEYAWNQVANMVFIESPCGVGFSYSSSDSDDDYKADDASTAEDNYALIQQFFARFPEYSNHDMYLTSESYGGHYIPTLSKEIVDQNTAGVNPHLNFKGFAVGNAFTTVYSGMPAMIETYWGHQLVAEPIYSKYHEECTLAKIPDLATCEMLFMDMYLQVGNINPYAVDYPVCTEDTNTHSRRGRAQRRWFLEHQLANASQLVRNAVLGEEEYEPCAADYSVSYLNLPEVKEAIHVKSDLTWAECSRSIRYKQTDGKNSMTPIYNYLIDGGYDLDILVYSGDDDAVCGTVGTQSWIWDLGYDVTGRMWQTYEVNEQVAGYATKWADAKLGFVTVHGAGHEVPTYTPEIALELWVKYLKGEWTN